MPLVFVDTNVLVYRRDSTEPSKQGTAQLWLSHLWASDSGRTSFQVLYEFYSVAARRAVGQSVARADIADLLAWSAELPSEQQVVEAWLIEERFRLSWWDALIVAAARLSGCDYLLTEDLQDGQDFGGLRVINPFSTAPQDIGLSPTTS